MKSKDVKFVNKKYSSSPCFHKDSPPLLYCNATAPRTDFGVLEAPPASLSRIPPGGVHRFLIFRFCVSFAFQTLPFHKSRKMRRDSVKVVWTETSKWSWPRVSDPPTCCLNWSSSLSDWHLFSRSTLIKVSPSNCFLASANCRVSLFTSSLKS